MRQLLPEATTNRVCPWRNSMFFRRRTRQCRTLSNANDLAKLCQMWLNKGTYGNERILSPKTVELFLTEKSSTSRRGLGFDKPDMENPEKSPTAIEASASTIGHLGFTGTCFWIDPEQELIYIFLCNRVYPSRTHGALSQLNIRPELFSTIYRSIKNHSK